MEGLEYCLAVSNTMDKKAVISALLTAGLRCSGEGENCQQFLRIIRRVQPHLAIMDVSLPGNVVETASIIDQEALSALLLVSRHNNKGLPPPRNLSFMVLALPVNELVINTAIEAVYLEFRRRRQLVEELCSLRSKLQARTVIEQAKGIIMKDFSIDEDRAYRYLQKRSMDQRLPLKEVAERVLSKK